MLGPESAAPQPPIPTGIGQLLEAIADNGGLKGFLGQQATADAIIGFFTDLGAPRLAVKFAYRLIILPVVEKGIDAAQAWAGKSMSRLARKTLVLLFSPDWIQKKLPGICDRIRALQPGALAPLRTNSIEAGDQKELAELRTWMEGFAEKQDCELKHMLVCLEELGTRLRRLERPPRLSTCPLEAQGDNDVLLAGNRGVEFVGREEELARLKEFLDSPEPFAWWAVSAQGGAGKTRLLLHFVEQYCGDWTAGFIQGDSEPGDWKGWEPTGPTLIVVDYAFAKTGLIRTLLIERTLEQDWAGQELSPKVRVIVLDRSFPQLDELTRDPTWGQVFDSRSDFLNYGKFFHGKEALALPPVGLSDLRRIVTQVSDMDGTVVDKTLEWLAGDENLQRPLFAILCGLNLKLSGEDPVPGTGRSSLISTYLASSHRLPWCGADRAAGRAAGLLVAGATACKGIPLEDTSVPEIYRGEVFDRSLPLARHVVGQSGTEVLQGLEPDLLGETFFLLLMNPGGSFGLAQHTEDREWLARFLWDENGGQARPERLGYCSEFIARTLVALGNEYRAGLPDRVMSELDTLWKGARRFLAALPDTAQGRYARQTAILHAGRSLSEHDAFPKHNVVDLLTEFDADAFGTAFATEYRDATLSALASLAMVVDRLAQALPPESLTALQDRSDAALRAQGEAALLICSQFGLHATLTRLFESGLVYPAQELGAITPLHVASYHGHDPVVKLLLDKGADTEARDKDQRTPLFVASQEGHAEVARLLLDKGADTEAREKYSQTTALHAAAFYGHDKVVALLLDKGAETDARDKDQRTPLFVAAQEGHAEVARLLVGKGADMEARDKDQWTPLHVATEGGHSEIVALLIDKVANIETRNKNQRTPLITAALRGHAEVVALLLDNGADTDARDKDSQATALHAAAQKGHTEVTKLLLEKGADSDARDKNHRTPLFEAALWGHAEVATLLLEKGADSDARDKAQTTALHAAAQEGHAEVAKMLLDKGADTEARDKDIQATALHLAAALGHTEVATLLLERGADTDAREKDRFTPLFVAALGGHANVVALLLEKGADTEARDKVNQATALHAATQKGHADVVAMLLDKGAYIDARNKDQRTPLHFAANKGDASIVELLINRGADKEVKDNSQSRPMHYAAFFGHKTVVELLLQHGSLVNVANDYEETPIGVALRNDHQEIANLLREHGAKDNVVGN